MSFPSDARQRFNELILNCNTIDLICEHVASGGTLVTLCEDWGIPFGYLTNWIRGDEARNNRYTLALADRDEHTVEKYLAELRALGISDIRAFYNEDNTLKDVKDWPDTGARAVQSIETDEIYSGRGESREIIGYTKKIKFWDKTKAIELIGKHLGLFSERIQHTHEVKLADLVKGSYTPKQTDTPTLALTPAHSHEHSLNNETGGDGPTPLTPQSQ